MDLRRIDDCFPAIDYFENRRLPFVVGVNRFPGAEGHDPADVRVALALGPDVPLVWLDARAADSGRSALVALVGHALARTAVRS